MFLPSIILYSFLTSFLTLIIYWYYYYYYKFLKICPNLPFIKPWPVIGNALEVVPMKDINQIMLTVMGRLGKTIKGIITFDTVIITVDEKFIEALTTSKDTLTKANEYKVMHSWLAEGLLTSTGKKWTQRRKLLTPSFHFNILEDFISIFNNCGSILIDKLKNEVGNESTNIYPYVTLCTLDVIYESTMGVTVNAQLKENSEYVQAVKLAAKILIQRAVHPFKRSDLLYKFSKDYYKEKKACKILHDTTDKIIETRRDYLLNNSNGKCNSDDVIENNNVYNKKRRAFMDILLESTIDGQPLTNDDIREEVDTFLFEGHDTTASAITFALYELSMNPHVQVKVLEELDSIFGKSKTKNVTFNDLQEMKYMELVIKETLRKYPSVPVLGRKNDADVQYDGMIIPKGTTIAVLPYVLHRNEETFPDPEKFDPDRFLPDNKTKIGPYAYIPFSAGYRNCIGQKFAMLEIKALLSKILSNYELRPVKDFKPATVTELILRSTNGISIKLIDRS